MQNFVGVCIADAAQYTWIGERALEGAIFQCERITKGVEIAIKYIDTAGIDRFQSILSQYPDRFSDAQKADLKRLCFVLQPNLDNLRAWPVANSDAPALYLKPLVEREKKSNAAPNLKSAPQPATPAKPNPTGKP